jgi:hypothetical protein
VAGVAYYVIIEMINPQPGWLITDLNYTFLNNSNLYFWTGISYPIEVMNKMIPVKSINQPPRPEKILVIF